MKFLIALAFVATLVSAEKEERQLRRAGKKFRGKKNAVCAIGCTPYVNPVDPLKGIDKYKALVDDMTDSCDLILHLGDTKAGAAPCNNTIMTEPLKIIVKSAKDKGVAFLYSIGDNELNDCHRDGSRSSPRAAEFYKAADARAFMISEMKMDVNFDKDMTGVFAVEAHRKNGTIPGTTKPYSCDFDKLLVSKDAVIATIESMGSSWYLADQTKQGYPNQDAVDPLADRLGMYLNAKDCAIEWISHAVNRANALGKKAVIIGMQAHFWVQDQYGSVVGPVTGALDGIGEYYNATNLAAKTLALTGVAIAEPFKPLYDHLTAVAKANPNLLIQTVNADSHIWTDIRANSAVNNNPGIISNQNWMIHQTEGDSRALTMYSKLTVDADAFNPVQVNQIWSKKAFDTIPVGHTYYRYA